MFGNVLEAKLIITDGLIIYGAATKTNLSGIESVQRRIQRIYFQETTRFLARNTCCEQNQYCLRAFNEQSSF